MQKAIYRNKLRVNQGILDKIYESQTPKLCKFFNDTIISNKMQINSYEKSILSTSVRHCGFNNENKKRFMLLK